MLLSLDMTEYRPADKPENRVGFCKEKNRLLREFLDAIHVVNELLTQQTQAVIDGDPAFGRFDGLLQLAQARKDQAKYAWIAHVESHHCEEA